MSDHSRRLLRNGSVYTFASVASTATALLITPVLTRSLGIEEYDKVAIAIVVWNFGINLLSLGLPTAIIRLVHAESAGRPLARGIAAMGFIVVIAASGTTALLAWACGFAPEIPWALLAGGAGGAVSMTLAYFVATENSRAYVIASFGLSLGGPVAGLFSTIALGPLAVNYVAGLGAAYTVVAVVCFLYLLSLSATFSIKRLRTALAIGLPIVPHQLAIGTAAGASVLLAAIALQTGSAAHAQLALLVASAPITIVSALSSAWTPVILSAPVEIRGERLSQTAGVIGWLAALGSGALAMLAPWFIGLLAPPEQFDTAPMVPVVAVAAASATVAVAYSSHLNLIIASGKTLALTILSPLALLLGFALGVLAAPVLGLLSSAVSFVSAYLLLLVFTRALARRVSPVRWSEKNLYVALGASAVASALGAALPWGSLVASLPRLILAVALLSGALAIFLRQIRSAPDGASIASARDIP